MVRSCGDGRIDARGPSSEHRHRTFGRPGRARGRADRRRAAQPLPHERRHDRPRRARDVHEHRHRRPRRVGPGQRSGRQGALSLRARRRRPHGSGPRHRVPHHGQLPLPLLDPPPDGGHAQGQLGRHAGAAARWRRWRSRRRRGTRAQASSARLAAIADPAPAGASGARSDRRGRHGADHRPPGPHDARKGRGEVARSGLENGSPQAHSVRPPPRQAGRAVCACRSPRARWTPAETP